MASYNNGIYKTLIILVYSKTQFSTQPLAQKHLHCQHLKIWLSSQLQTPWHQFRISTIHGNFISICLYYGSNFVMQCERQSNNEYDCLLSNFMVATTISVFLVAHSFQHLNSRREWLRADYISLIFQLIFHLPYHWVPWSSIEKTQSKNCKTLWGDVIWITLLAPHYLSGLGMSRWFGNNWVGVKTGLGYLRF